LIRAKNKPAVSIGARPGLGVCARRAYRADATKRGILQIVPS